MNSKITATVVFEQNWKYANTVAPDGSRPYRYLINSGSSRSSKTFSLIQLFYLYAASNPNKKLSVFRDTKQMCKQTVFEDMKKIYYDMPGYSKVVLNITESVFKFPNGSAIHIEGTDDSVKIHGYQCNVLWINEGYNVSKDTFDQLDMRCTDFVLLDLNPRQSHWSEEVAKGANAITIHSTFRQNPYVPEEQRKKILSYEPVHLCELVVSKQMTLQQALVYDMETNPAGFGTKQVKELARCRENEAKNTANEFNYNVYGLGIKAERPNRIHHWKEIDIELYRKIDGVVVVGVDWGTVDPWGIVEAKYYDGALYLHELNYASENEIRSKLSATDLASINAIETSEDKQDGGGIVKWKFNKLGIDKKTAIVCDTNRPIKIAALRRAGWVYAVPAMKGAGSIKDGIDLLNNMAVYYTSASPNIKYEQENYSRKVDRYGVVLEEPEDTNNHIAGDPARYVAQYMQARGIIKQL